MCGASSKSTGASSMKTDEGVEPSLRANLDRALALLSRADWVRQYMMASSVETDVGVLHNPGSMQAAVVAISEDHHHAIAADGKTGGTFAQRYLVAPAFTADGISVGAIVTHYADRKHPLHNRQIFTTDILVGRWVRDDITGEWLVITRGKDITRIMWIGDIRSTSRQRIAFTCMTSLFDEGDVAKSVIFECNDVESRSCPLCGSPPGICGGCNLPVIRARHPLDFEASSANLMAVGGGEWAGEVQVTIFAPGQGVREPSVSPLASGHKHICRHSRDVDLATALKNLAITEMVQSADPVLLRSSPTLSPEESALRQAFSCLPTLSADALSGSLDWTGGGAAAAMSLFSPSMSVASDTDPLALLAPPPPTPQDTPEEHSKSNMNSSSASIEPVASTPPAPDSASVPNHTPPHSVAQPAAPAVPTVSSVPAVPAVPAVPQQSHMIPSPPAAAVLSPMTTISATPVLQPPATPIAGIAIPAHPHHGHHPHAHHAQHAHGLAHPAHQSHAAAVAAAAAAGLPMGVVIDARLIEQQRAHRAEERRRKNREAAARSNARAREKRDSMKAIISKNRERIEELSTKEKELAAENERLRAQLAGQPKGAALS